MPDPAFLAALARIEKLEAVLRKYGTHSNCAMARYPEHGWEDQVGGWSLVGEGVQYVCTCGLAAALQPAEGEGLDLLGLAVECWTNGRKWAELGHLEPLHEQDASCRREVDAFLSSLPSPSLAPLREHERAVARRIVEAVADKLVVAPAGHVRSFASSDATLDAMLWREPSPAPQERKECGTGKAGEGETK